MEESDEQDGIDSASEGEAEFVYHQDGVVLRNRTLLVANAYVGDPEDLRSEISVYVGGLWERFDVPTDCIVTLAAAVTASEAYAVGRNGLYMVLPATVGTDVDAWMAAIRIGVIRDVHDTGELMRCKIVDGVAYCVGQCGQVYRLDIQVARDHSFGMRSDEGPDLEGIDGVSADCLYACGPGGTVLHFDGRAWSRLDVPTNVNLSSVLVRSADSVLFAGDRGTLLHLERGRWTVVEGDPQRNYWDICAFNGWPVLSHTSGVDYFDGRQLRPLPVGLDASMTYHRLSASGDLLMSTGERHIVTVAGTTWALVDEA